MCIVMGADTATIPSLRQAPDVVRNLSKTVHFFENNFVNLYHGNKRFNNN